MMNEKMIARLEAMGCERWTKHGMDRLYVNERDQFVELTGTFFTLDWRDKVWIDVNDGTVHAKYDRGCGAYAAKVIAKAIEMIAEEIEAEEAKEAEAKEAEVEEVEVETAEVETAEVETAKTDEAEVTAKRLFEKMSAEDKIKLSNKAVEIAIYCPHRYKQDLTSTERILVSMIQKEMSNI